MKKLIVLICFGLVAGAIAEVEYGSLMGNAESVTLAAGETFTLLANNFNKGGGAINLYSPPSANSYIELDYYYHQTAAYDSRTFHATLGNYGVIAGPCRIELSSSSGYCSYKITRHEVTASPMNIISLPDTNNGDVDVLIESSTDLLSWTPVYSGSAGTSNNAAFFRTRLIQN